VDGEATPVLLANGYQRAVLIPPGSREVVFRYRPEGLVAGLCASAAAWVLAMVWAIPRQMGR
jgi:hypothetical protein